MLCSLAIGHGSSGLTLQACAALYEPEVLLPYYMLHLCSMHMQGCCYRVARQSAITCSLLADNILHEEKKKGRRMSRKKGKKMKRQEKEEE